MQHLLSQAASPQVEDPGGFPDLAFFPVPASRAFDAGLGSRPCALYFIPPGVVCHRAQRYTCTLDAVSMGTDARPPGSGGVYLSPIGRTRDLSRAQPHYLNLTFSTYSQAPLISARQLYTPLRSQDLPQVNFSPCMALWRHPLGSPRPRFTSQYFMPGSYPYIFFQAGHPEPPPVWTPGQAPIPWCP